MPNHFLNLNSQNKVKKLELMVCISFWSLNSIFEFIIIINILLNKKKIITDKYHSIRVTHVTCTGHLKQVEQYNCK